jgi:hypothetical protein
MSLSVADRLRLERMIEQGIDLNALEARRVAENLQDFRENAVRVNGMVLERIDEGEAVIGDLIQDLEAMPFLEAELLQADNLERAIEPLEEMQDGLYDKLEAGEKELRILEQHNRVLKATAEKLKLSLQAAKGRYSFERPLYNAGSMTSMSIAKPINQ